MGALSCLGANDKSLSAVSAIADPAKQSAQSAEIKNLMINSPRD
jgi:hypothetical protein